MSSPAFIESSSARIESMPLDLSQVMLTYLPSDSLLSLIHASPVMRRVLFNDLKPICRHVALNDVGRIPLPFAIALYHAQRSSPAPTQGRFVPYTDRVIAFCNQYLKNIRSPIKPQAITLEMVIGIGRFARVAQGFARIVAGEPSFASQFPTELSENEWQRIVKTVYIYELASRVARLGVTLLEPAWRIFWEKFAPWETCHVPPLELCIANLWIEKCMPPSLTVFVNVWTKRKI